MDPFFHIIIRKDFVVGDIGTLDSEGGNEPCQFPGGEGPQKKGQHLLESRDKGRVYF